MSGRVAGRITLSNWSKANKPKVRSWAKDYRLKNPAYALLAAARNRARKYGLPFELKASDIIVPEFCPVLGIKLQINDGVVGPNSPSLDRFDYRKGYVTGNVRVISFKANTIKSNAKVWELEAVVQYMKESGDGGPGEDAG